MEEMKHTASPRRTTHSDAYLSSGPTVCIAHFDGLDISCVLEGFSVK